MQTRLHQVFRTARLEHLTDPYELGCAALRTKDSEDIHLYRFRHPFNYAVLPKRTTGVTKKGGPLDRLGVQDGSYNELNGMITI